MRGMWWVPWSMLMAMAPVALYAIWQVCGRRWRLSVFMLTGVLLLQVLFALALWRGFGDVMAWMALLLVLCWYLMLAGLPALFIGWRYRRQGWPAWLRVATASAFFALIGVSLFNAYTPVVRHAHIQLDKPLEKPLRLLLAADLHLYWLFGNRQLDWLAHTAQREKADMVLMPGDIINDHLRPYAAYNMAPHLASVRAPLGVFATLGNHEFYGDALANAQALRDAGIRVLRDEALVVDGRLIIAGRDDDMQRGRKSLKAILAGMDTSLPVLVLDHRPTHIAENAAAGADIQFSGHTHGGQIFPVNWIVREMYRLHHGHARMDGMEVVVTSGYGFWGLPFRLATRSEVWLITLSGKAEK